jgi:hypothetical protein
MATHLPARFPSTAVIFVSQFRSVLMDSVPRKPPYRETPADRVTFSVYHPCLTQISSPETALLMAV